MLSANGLEGYVEPVFLGKKEIDDAKLGKKEDNGIKREERYFYVVEFALMEIFKRNQLLFFL